MIRQIRQISVHNNLRNAVLLSSPIKDILANEHKEKKLLYFQRQQFLGERRELLLFPLVI